MNIEKIIFYVFKKIYNRSTLFLRVHYYKFAGVVIGKDCFISPKAFIDISKSGLIEIGENCMITRDCIILCHSDEKKGGIRKLFGEREYGTVKIGNNVFIGVDSVILPGTTIGDNVVIGAKSLVKGNIPSNCVALGIPAKKYKEINEFLGEK